jgi:hypothetical protein
LLDCLVELVEWRAVDRARQRELRLDRGRTVSRRDLQDPYAGGLTLHERDRRNTNDAVARRSVEKLVASGLVEPSGIELATKCVSSRLATADLPPSQVAAMAWSVAFQMLTPDDWKPGAFILTESGTWKLFATAVRAFLVARCGNRRPAGTIDGWWVASVRPILADHEIGIILAAADKLDGPGPRHNARMEWVLERPTELGSLREHPSVVAALDEKISEFETDSGQDFARLAVERWQRLRRCGWEEARKKRRTTSR